MISCQCVQLCRLGNVGCACTFIGCDSQGWDSSTFMRISVEQKLKSVVDDDHFRGGKNRRKKKKNPKQSESVFGLSAFCCVLKLFPDVRAHCIVLAFKNGHANIITRSLFIQGLLVFNA